MSKTSKILLLLLTLTPGLVQAKTSLPVKATTPKKVRVERATLVALPAKPHHNSGGIKLFGFHF
jgi:hypothetical protein